MVIMLLNFSLKNLKLLHYALRLTAEEILQLHSPIERVEKSSPRPAAQKSLLAHLSQLYMHACMHMRMSILACTLHLIIENFTI